MIYNNNSNVSRVTLFILALFGLCAGVQATENGAPTTAVGVYDFGAGMMPPATPFGTLGLRTAFYSANVQKDRHGRSLDNNFSLDVLSIGLAYMRMTDYSVLGAKYGFGTVVPFFKMDASLEVPTPGGPLTLEADPFRLADVQFLPLILQWTLSPNLFVNTQFQIQAPTGDYDKTRLISPGSITGLFPLSSTRLTSTTPASRCRRASRWTSTRATRIPTTRAAWSTVMSSPWDSTSAPGPLVLVGTTTVNSPMMTLRA